METAECGTCKQAKPVDQFYRNPYSESGTRLHCKACTSDARRRRYADSPDGADRSYEQVLKREYGITLEQYNAMVRAQGNRCAICRRPESVTYKNGRVKRLAVDHDHATNTVRALLCHRCNLLVWALEDNHTTLGAVEAYVLQHRESFANGAPV